MKKSVLLSALASAMIIGGATVAQAEGTGGALTPPKEVNPAGFNSKGTVVVPPIDPTQPIEPIQPIDPDPNIPGGTGDDSLLSIDQVPFFNFSKENNKGTDSRGVYLDETVQSGEKNFKKNVQVTDRREEKKGWTLQLNMGKFALKTDPTVVLSKTSIHIPLSVDGETSHNISKAPTLVGLGGKDVIDTDVSIDDKGIDAKIATAQPGEGAGTWVIYTDKASMKLPGGVAPGAYESTFNWKLSSTPV